MEETRLFEIGLKDKPHSAGYSHKYYVSAHDADEAVEKARAFILKDFVDWWEEEGRGLEETKDVAELDTLLRSELDRLRAIHLARVQDVGTLIV